MIQGGHGGSHVGPLCCSIVTKTSVHDGRQTVEESNQTSVASPMYWGAPIGGAFAVCQYFSATNFIPFSDT